MRAWKITACVWFTMAGAAAGCQRSRPPALTPGETKVLVDYTERFGSSRSEPPARDRETLRYVINITALKDGWLPKRASRAESGSNRFP